MRTIWLTVFLFGCGSVKPSDDFTKLFPEVDSETAYVTTSPIVHGGWYTNYSDPNRGDDLGIMLRDLSEFKSGPISENWLATFETKLSAQPDNSIILRFKYADGAGSCPIPSIVKAHIRQLAPAMERQAKKIFVLQAGFIGAWGEWHDNGGAVAGTKELLADKHAIFEELGRAWHGYLQLRTPELREEILPAFDSALKKRTGVHNDCFLASESDFGTYGKPTAHWSDYPTVLNGGETCAVSDFTGCEVAEREIRRLDVRYLNRTYNMDVLNGWKTGGCYDRIGEFLRTGL